MLAEEITEERMSVNLSGLPVDQQRAVRTLVDALSWREDPSAVPAGIVLTRREVEEA